MKKLLLIILPICFTCCNFKLVNERKLNSNEIEFSYQNGDIIETFSQIGLFDNYKVYNCFRKIKSADSYHGQSFILFLSNKDSLVYRLEQKENLPDSVINNLFYKNGVSNKVLELTNPLCLYGECYELEEGFREIILSLDSLP